MEIPGIWMLNLYGDVMLVYQYHYVSGDIVMAGPNEILAENLQPSDGPSDLIPPYKGKRWCSVIYLGVRGMPFQV